MLAMVMAKTTAINKLDDQDGGDEDDGDDNGDRDDNIDYDDVGNDEDDDDDNDYEDLAYTQIQLTLNVIFRLDVLLSPPPPPSSPYLFESVIIEVISCRQIEKDPSESIKTHQICIKLPWHCYTYARYFINSMIFWTFYSNHIATKLRPFYQTDWLNQYWRQVKCIT